MKNLIEILIMTISFLIGILCNNIYMMIVSIFALFIFMIIYAIKNKEETIVLLVFLISFFTFLLTQYFNKDWINKFSKETNIHIALCLYLSLCRNIYWKFII